MNKGRSRRISEPGGSFRGFQSMCCLASVSRISGSNPGIEQTLKCNMAPVPSQNRISVLWCDKSHTETLMIHKLTSRNFAARNDLEQSYRSKRAVILIETKLINYTCLQMKCTQTRSGLGTALLVHSHPLKTQDFRSTRKSLLREGIHWSGVTRIQQVHPVTKCQVIHLLESEFCCWSLCIWSTY